MKRYDMVGEYDFLEIAEVTNGDYYKVSDVKKLLRKIIFGNSVQELYYVHARIPREVWDEVVTIVKQG